MNRVKYDTIPTLEGTTISFDEYVQALGLTRTQGINRTGKFRRGEMSLESLWKPIKIRGPYLKKNHCEVSDNCLECPRPRCKYDEGGADGCQ